MYSQAFRMQLEIILASNSVCSKIVTVDRLAYTQAEREGGDFVSS